MEADVPRSLAHRARFLLRPALPRSRICRPPKSATALISRSWPRRATSITCSPKCWANSRSGTCSWAAATRPRSKRVHDGLLGADYKIENGRYRFARVYNGENWNPQAEGAAHAAGRQRRGRRIPAGGERARGACRRTMSTASSKPPPASSCAEGRAGSGGRQCARGDSRAGGQTRTACATWRGSRTTAAKWTR